MIIASVQPCFIPWQGYFEQMLLAEVFVYLDDVQYTRRDWRNRNRLLSPGGVKNVHVPVGNAGRSIKVNEALISYNEPWEDRLRNQLLDWYGRAPFYGEIMALLDPPLSARYERLVDLNDDLNRRILDYLGHDTRIERASGVPRRAEDRNGRIIELCNAFDGDLLYDGKSAADFIDTGAFARAGIEVVFQDFVHRPYPQLGGGEFEPYLSVVDLLMNQGPESKTMILSNPSFPTNERLRERRSRLSVS